jgi:hypothetical protein
MTVTSGAGVALTLLFPILGRISAQPLVRDAYLRSLGINTIALGSWDRLPEFFKAINPKNALDTI